MEVSETNTWFNLATETINYTSQNLFLTGKAGTGKTTFLKYIKEHTHKNAVVVAPTGVAAINAGGVTMHSFFQLPFLPYLPALQNAAADTQHDWDYNTGHKNFVDRYTLLKGLRISVEKSNLINELELLIMDEVSMLRSDMLDAINEVLCHVRGNKKPFGGVQVLFIGDLFQLPPVVQDSEWQVLQTIYKSPYFFSARVLENNAPLFIELKHVYRQSEQRLIDLLNNIRHNTMTEGDYALLRDRYISLDNIKPEGVITLTTHNRVADEINRKELNKLPGHPLTFTGEIKGAFSEKTLPADMELHLKPGAQVMFTKNDSTGEKKYYNGKLATVKDVRKDEIWVRFNDSDTPLKIEKEKWRTVEYTLDRNTNKIEEKETGSFTQYPLRLAWAVTIHKSQGLTFDKAIIDAGNSFASGQVYVALSRCRSLDGIFLLSPIHPGSIINDERIVDFANQETPEDEIKQLLEIEKYKYAAQLLVRIFDFHKLAKELEHLDALTQPKKGDIYIEVKQITALLVTHAHQQKEVADKFIAELDKKFNDEVMDTLWFNTKVPAGKTYFINRMQKELMAPIDNAFTLLKGKPKVRQYVKYLGEVKTFVHRKANDIHKAAYLDLAFESGLPDIKIQAANITETLAKADKGTTKRITLDLYKQGKTVTDIATLRNLAPSTIEGHLADSFDTGEIDITHFVSDTLLNQIKTVADNLGTDKSGLIKNELAPQVTYTQIKMALAYWKSKTAI